MSRDKTDVLIVGFGAVGIVYSYIVKHAGRANVTCVARGNYDATQENGVHIRSRKYGDDIYGWRPDRLFRTVAEAADRQYSYVIVATKAIPEVTPLPSILAPLFSRSDDHRNLPTFVILQNGLFVERDLYNHIKGLGVEEPRVISAAVWIGTRLLEGNIVEHTLAERLFVGIYRPTYRSDIVNSAQETAVLKGFADLLEPSGSTVNIVNEVLSAKFKKNLLNFAIGTCSTIVRQPPQFFFNNPDLNSFMVPQIRAIMREALAVGRAMGFDEQVLPPDIVETTIQSTKKLYQDPTFTHKLSMHIDLEVKRPMEIEAIVGEVVRIADELNVDIPQTRLIYAFLKVLQHSIIG